MVEQTTKPQEQLSATEDGFFAGWYPQNVAAAEAEAAMEPTPNEWGYYRSRYDGKLYARLYVRGEGVYSDGTPMIMGVKRYFEVQPIGWYPFNIADGKRLLVSRQVLFVRPFDMQTNSWSDSYLREQLQQFGLSCLDSKTKARIASLPLDNDSVGQEVCMNGRRWVLNTDNAPWSEQPVTWDGVFLLSRAEWQGVQNAERTFSPTDYAKAMGATEVNGYGTGWLRTADATADRVATFGFEWQDAGLVEPDSGAEISRELGVLPAVCIELP